MDQPLFWTKIGAIGEVAGAVATFAAVCVSLWLARSEQRPHIKVQAGLRLLFAGDGSPFTDVISIRVTNFGLRPVRISSVGWRTGWMKRGPKWLTYQHAVQKFDFPVPMVSSQTLPCDLGAGQEVLFYISPEPFKKADDTSRTFFSRRLPWRHKSTPTKICVAVFMVASRTLMTRVEPNLEKFLATGVITGGAEKANKAASAKPE
jgi:hypothetical protein